MKSDFNRESLLTSIVLLGLCLFFSSCSSIFSRVDEKDEDTRDYNQSTVGGSYPFSNELEEDSQRNAKWSAPKNTGIPSPQSFQSATTQAPKRMKKEDFIDQSRADGSLWSSDGQSNYFFTKNKIHNRGDLITITADETLVRDIADEIKRNLSEDEQETELELSRNDSPTRQPSSQKKEEDKKEDIADPKTAAAEEAPAVEKDPEKIAKKANWRTLDLRPAIEFKAGDPVMVEVLDRYPNGNYKIKGLKRIRHRGQVRVVEVLAIAKGTDINDDDQIAAGKLYEYRLTSMQ